MLANVRYPKFGRISGAEREELPRTIGRYFPWQLTPIGYAFALNAGRLFVNPTIAVIVGEPPRS